ncbi:MAG: DUF1700 domain-containing protein [Oscillospiraceae bacterium]|jgi:uncharacterized membrane protein|nr:DUF1700 domain-containing protein [Oscillospiraceae bacterium]
MTKSEFLLKLQSSIKDIPDYEKALAYYSEMLDDRMEDGMSEEEAVTSLGSIEAIRGKLIDETALQTIIRSRSSVPLTATAIVLIILGFPLWFPLVLTALILLFTLFITVMLLIMTAFLILFSFALSGVVMVITSPFMIAANPLAALFSFGAGLASVGIAMLLLYPAIYFAKGLWSLVKLAGRAIKSIFVKRRVS